MNGEAPQRVQFGTSVSADPRLIGVRGENDRQKKMNRLLSMKYNQRSVLDFHEAGLCGPKADLLENKPKSIQDECAEMMEDPSADYHLYWEQPPSRMFVVKKIGDPQVTKKFVEVALWLIEEKSMKLIVEPAVMEDPESKKYPELFEEHRNSLDTWTLGNKESQRQVLGKTDLLICLGGDGTLLYAASLFENTVPPIVSLAMGSLGFLTSFFADSYQETIDRVLKKHVSITQRLRLECKFVSDQEVKTKMEEMCYITPPIPEDEMLKFEFTPKKSNSGKKSLEMVKRQDFTCLEDKTLRKSSVVMNEIVVDRGSSPFLTNIEIFCNQRLMTTVQGDGIIVATPTGSTAYALAAGASMVHPSVSSIIICPICPHSLSFRPVVIPAGVEVMIRVSPDARNTAWVGFDGRDREELRKGDSVVITASQNPVPCINNTGHVTDWFDSLARCLNWNVREIQKALP